MVRKPQLNSTMDHPTTDAYLLFANAAFLVLGLMTTLSNAFIILVIRKSKRLRRKDGFGFVGLLASADGLIGAGAILTASARLSVQLRGWTALPTLCVALTVVCTAPHLSRGMSHVVWRAYQPMLLGMTWSQLVAGAMALDRLSAVRHPNQYRVRNHNFVLTRSAALTGWLALLSVSLQFIHLRRSLPRGWLLFDSPNTEPRAGLRRVQRGRCLGRLVPNVLDRLLLPQRHFRRPHLGLPYLLGLSGSDLRLRQGEGRQLSIQSRVTKTIAVIMASYFFLWFLPNSVFGLGSLAGWQPPSRLGPLIGIGCLLSASLNLPIYASNHSQFRHALLSLGLIPHWKPEPSVTSPNRSTSPVDHAYQSLNTSKPSVSTTALSQTRRKSHDSNM